MVVSLYTRGMATREIGISKECTTLRSSSQFVSRTTEQLLQQITDRKNRNLDGLYVLVLYGLCVAFGTREK